MRKIVFIFLIMGGLFLSACNNIVDTTKKAVYVYEDMFDSGFIAINTEKLLEGYKEYNLNKKMFSLEKEKELSGTQKYSMYNVALDSLNGLYCVLASEFENSGYKLPDNYKDISSVMKLKKEENKNIYYLYITDSDYKEVENYLKLEYGEKLYYDYIFDEKNQQATAYIYSNTKDPNYVVTGTKLKLEIYKIKREYEGKTREENSTKK